MKDPKVKMWLALVVVFVLMGLALFLSAGTADYWQAWVFLGVGAVSGILLDLFIMKDPVLLESRTKFGPTAEQRPLQKIIVLCAGLPAIAAFIVPALDRRFGWSNMPLLAFPGGRSFDTRRHVDGIPGVQRELIRLRNRRDRH